jgi:hypothetical protein
MSDQRKKNWKQNSGKGSCPTGNSTKSEDVQMVLEPEFRSAFGRALLQCRSTSSSMNRQVSFEVGSARLAKGAAQFLSPTET